MSKNLIMTEDGYNALEERLKYLKVHARKEVADKISIAREYGDLSENFEYDAAKNEQAVIEGEISQIEAYLDNAEVVYKKNINKKFAGVGCKIKVLDLEFNEELEYSLVGTIEANSEENKISNVSPLGEAVIGHKVGDTFEVKLPNGVSTKYKLLAINIIK